MDTFFHNLVISALRFPVSIVTNDFLDFSWDDCNAQEGLETTVTVCKIEGGGGGGLNKVHHGSGENDQYTSTGELQSRSVLKNMINTNLFIKLLKNNLQMPMRTVRP